MTIDACLAQLRRRLEAGKSRKSRTRDALKPAVENLELREVLSTAQYHFDFGTSSSPLSPSYTRASTDLYSSAQGFGWQSASGLSSYSASSGDALTRDGVQGQSSGTFLVDLPNGDYYVTATLGHPSSRRDNVAIFAEGQRAATGITSSAGSYQRATFNLRVNDGQLGLRFLDEGGSNNLYSLAALDIQGSLAPVAGWGFDDGSGGTARDATVNGLNGTVSGASWSSAGKFGGALSFNGTNSLVTVADNALLDFRLGMTLEAWVKPNAPAPDWSTVVLKERTGGMAYALYGADNAGQPPAGYINRNGNDLNATGTSALPLNAWSHLATTYDGSALKLYLNGQQVASRAVTGAITVSDGALRIGGNSVWGEYFSGLIDEVRVYNRALSAAEISADMTRPVNAPVGAPPTADAGADRTGNEGSAVNFTGTATGTGLTYLWDFGDGSTLAGTLTASHVYADNGTYTATLTVTDSAGRTSSDSAAVAVSNVAPTSGLDDNNPVAEGSPVNIFFSGQSDPSSADTNAGFRYSYDFNNDGVFDLVNVTQSSAQYTFNDNGTYTVRGRITDKDGGFTDVTDTVTVTNVAPSAAFSGPASVVLGNAATFAFSNVSDPSGPDTQAGFRYSYDFNNDGTFEVSNSTSASASFTYTATGNYTVKGRVADKDGGFRDYTTTITVTSTTPPPAPTANAGVDRSGNEGSAVSFTGTATGTGLTYSWAWGDGTSATAGTLTPTHAYADNGTYTVTLTVTDSLGRTASDTAVATVANVAPSAALANSGPAVVNTPVTFTFSNQSDPSGPDTQAGFRYSYDFNNDGTFEVSNSTSASANYTYTSAGSYTARGRIADKDGGFRDYTTTVTITNTGGGFLRTLYVSPSGSDSNPGSSSQPWRTLQYAADQARAGDQIIVRAGTYVGFQITTSGTAANRIEFKADPGVLVNAKQPSVSSSSGAINLEGASYVTIDGFNVTLASYGSVRSNIRSVENTGAIIRNNTIDNASWWGILTGNSANLLAEYNTITNTQIQHGIYVANSADNPTLRGNYVANSRGAGIQINADKDLPGDGIISNALVVGNRLFNNARIEASSLNLNGVEDSRVINNLIVSQYRNGIAMYQDNQTAGTKRNLIANNTIVGPAWYAISISGAGSTHNRIFNNILFSQAWASSYRGGLGVENITGLQSNNNILVGRVNRDPANTESPSESASQWRARGFDTNSIFLEERFSSATAALSNLFVTPPSWPFSSPETGNYHLKAGALAINGGAALADVLTDIEGKNRDGTPDIGAYEL